MARFDHHDHYFSDQESNSSSPSKLVNTLYHMLDPSGLFLLMEEPSAPVSQAIREFMAENGFAHR
jgi:hypothetical protein